MRYLLSILCIISFILSGCNHDTHDTKDFELTNLLNLSTSIDEYRLTMSSVPGLPLEFKTENNDKLAIKIELESGTLIQWNSLDGKVTDLGSEILIDYNDIILYWSPIVTNNIEKVNEVKMFVYIVDKESHDVLDSGTYYIVENNGGYKLLQLVFTNDF